MAHARSTPPRRGRAAPRSRWDGARILTPPWKTSRGMCRQPRMASQGKLAVSVSPEERSRSHAGPINRMV